MLRFASALAALLIAAPAVAQTAPARVILEFQTGAATGKVMVGLYDSQTAYDGGAPLRQAALDVAAGQTSAVFEDLPAGDYAAKAFHDVDGDGDMDRNPFGIPIEPYAFSNNAVGNMGPASWDRARFAVGGDTAQTIQIK